MPRIASFRGIDISMFYGDHAPPHIHVWYSGHTAKIDIATGEVIAGRIPRRVLVLVREWILRSREELRANWELAAMNEALRRIGPFR